MDRDVVGGSRSHHEDIGVVLKAMKLVMGLVFVGWLMLWILVPTKIYKYNWLPKLQANTNSTYFGIQGTNMLIFTFPILFISVLGCIYLHLQVKGSSRIQRGSFTRRLAVWKKPVIVRWPLGIVSGIELSFCFMFLALLIWYFSMYLSVGFSSLHGVPNEGEKLWQSKLDTAAVRLALVGNLCCAFLFFPVTRMSSLLPLVGLNSESCIKYHVWLGHTVMILFTSHGTCYVVYWATTNQIDEMLKWTKIGIANVAGELALLTGLVMWATTFPRIRRKMFELFLYAHQLYILLLFFYQLHVGIDYFFSILPGIYLFMIDRFLRFLQSRNKVRLISARLLPSETLELNFSKNPGFSYNPISSVFINVPSISSLQWHPFTVSSNGNLEPDKLSIIIKKEGSWTQKLYQKLSSPCPNDRLDISLEGPYGPTSMDFLRYDSLIMVSGGSGITPFISIIRELIHRSTNLDSPTPSVLLICAFKTSADLTMLDLLLPASGDVSDLSHLQLRVEAFITREKALADGTGKIIRTVWFKPIASDVPISPVLGPNSWFWLGAIVSSSFVVFLVLIGILTRYYIYPIDHDTNAIYSSSARALLNLLFICFSIIAVASIAVLWNKRGSAMEAKQVQNMDAPSPATTPSSWFHNDERELESVPLESIVKATKVHYGARPEFKKMLLEYDGSNVGVMASGPTKMRHEVAGICSSGLADKLHFESISFSW